MMSSSEDHHKQLGKQTRLETVWLCAEHLREHDFCAGISRIGTVRYFCQQQRNSMTWSEFLSLDLFGSISSFTCPCTPSGAASELVSLWQADGTVVVVAVSDVVVDSSILIQVCFWAHCGLSFLAIDGGVLASPPIKLERRRDEKTISVNLLHNPDHARTSELLLAIVRPPADRSSTTTVCTETDVGSLFRRRGFSIRHSSDFLYVSVIEIIRNGGESSDCEMPAQTLF